MIKYLTGKELCEALGISTTLLYKFRKAGMPYHQLPGGRPFYLIDQVVDWLKNAEQIIAYREQNGSFQKIEDLMQVSGIGEKTFASLKDQLAI